MQLSQTLVSHEESHLFPILLSFSLCYTHCLTGRVERSLPPVLSVPQFMKCFLFKEILLNLICQRSATSISYLVGNIDEAERHMYVWLDLALPSCVALAEFFLAGLQSSGLGMMYHQAWVVSCLS